MLETIATIPNHPQRQAPSNDFIQGHKKAAGPTKSSLVQTHPIDQERLQLKKVHNLAFIGFPLSASHTYL